MKKLVFAIIAIITLATLVRAELSAADQVYLDQQAYQHNKLELTKSEELEIKFLRDILQAELLYVKTRGFWDM